MGSLLEHPWQQQQTWWAACLTERPPHSDKTLGAAPQVQAQRSMAALHRWWEDTNKAVGRDQLTNSFADKHAGGCDCCRPPTKS